MFCLISHTFIQWSTKTVIWSILSPMFDHAIAMRNCLFSFHVKKSYNHCFAALFHSLWPFSVRVIIKVTTSLFYSSRPPHKLSSIISSLLTQRQQSEENAGQLNSKQPLNFAAKNSTALLANSGLPVSSAIPPGMSAAQALWAARHSQHLKNAKVATSELENSDAGKSNNAQVASIKDEGKGHCFFDLTFSFLISSKVKYK